MRYSLIAIFTFIVLLAAFSAGCTSDSAPAPVVTTIATPEPVTTTVILTATPTQKPTAESRSIEVMPEGQQVTLELSKDRPTSEIHLLYQGGPGAVFTQKVVMRVYNTAGEYQEYVMSDGKKPQVGNEIVAKGTRGGDRCTVFVTSGGITYKVMDETLYSDL